MVHWSVVFQLIPLEKECVARGQYLYSYKGVDVPPLAMIDDLACVSTCGVDTVKANSYLNSKTNLKKLQFGPDKCHKMHIGKKKMYCPDLHIDSWKMNLMIELETKVYEETDKFEGDTQMEETKEEKYLGDIITDDGLNKKNIDARKGKGLGIINQIKEILHDISFGPSYFEIANLLRHSLFLSSVLLNSEVWYGLSHTDIEQLEQVDQALLRMILEAPSSTPKVSLYLEMGCVPIRFIIKNRRIMFLHYILHQNESSLLFKFFNAQLDNPVKGDWSEQVLLDLKEINLQLTLEEIKNLSKETFRVKLKKAIDGAALKWLIEEKEKKSKIKSLNYEQLKMQSYLGGSDLETSDKKFLFQMRCRMIDVKSNYKNNHSDLSCALCGTREDDQKHVMECPILINNTSDISTGNMNYDDIFGDDVIKQAKIVRIFRNLWKKRKNLMKEGWHPNIVSHVI